MGDNSTISTELDNSMIETEQTEPVNTDNSDVSTSEPMQEETKQEVAEEQKADKPIFDNLEAAITGYKNLQKKMGEQSNELGNLRKQAEELAILKEKQNKFAQHYGYEDIQALEKAQLEQEQVKELASFEADEYAKYINECDYPDEMKNLLLQYRQNPTNELLEMIESEFSSDVLKNVAAKKAIYEQSLQNQRVEAENQQTIQVLQDYLNTEVAKYPTEFNNQAFTELYAEAFKVLGVNLDTGKLVNLVNNYAQSIVKNNGIQANVAKENNSATDEIAGISNNNSSSNSYLSNKKLSDMTESEISQYVKNYL